MDGEFDPRAGRARAHAERRRRRRKAFELHRRRSAERMTYLLAQLELGETVVAAGSQALVTDRRVLFAWRLGLPPRPREWTHDALTFAEITRWSVGRRHDHRPLLTLGHPPHVRVEQVIAHRFLWARWGNTERGVSHEETTLYFVSRRDPVFRAIKQRLELTNATQGEPFAEILPGTREERLGGGLIGGFSYVSGGRFRALTRFRRQLANLDEYLHHGQITWWIRVASWLLLAVPAWVITPWLVLPAIVLVEGAWIAGLQWSWRRDRRRVTLPEDY